MTNTLATMYSSATTGITGAVDGFVAIGVLITLALAGFAVVAKFLPRKKKVV